MWRESRFDALAAAIVTALLAIFFAAACVHQVLVGAWLGAAVFAGALLLVSRLVLRFLDRDAVTVTISDHSVVSRGLLTRRHRARIAIDGDTVVAVEPDSQVAVIFGVGDQGSHTSVHTALLFAVRVRTGAREETIAVTTNRSDAQRVARWIEDAI